MVNLVFFVSSIYLTKLNSTKIYNAYKIFSRTALKGKISTSEALEKHSPLLEFRLRVLDVLMQS